MVTVTPVTCLALLALAACVQQPLQSQSDADTQPAQPLGQLMQAKSNPQAARMPISSKATYPPVYKPNSGARNPILQRFPAHQLAQARLATGVIQMRRIRDLIADLTGAGFVLVSTRGSHHRYQNGATNVNLAYHNPGDNAHHYQVADVANALAAVAPAVPAAKTGRCPA